MLWAFTVPAFRDKEKWLDGSCERHITTCIVGQVLQGAKHKQQTNIIHEHIINTFVKGPPPSALHCCCPVSKGESQDIRATNRRVEVYISSGNQFLELVLTKADKGPGQKSVSQWLCPSATTVYHCVAVDIDSKLLLCQSPPITMCLFSISFTGKQENILGKKILLV